MRFVDFCSDVINVNLTPGQRCVALVGIDGTEPGHLTGDSRWLASTLFGPIETVPSSARSVVLLLKGARTGGTYVFGALYSLWRALTADLSMLAAGELASALVVAPDMRLGRQCLRFALGAARSVPSIAALIESETSDGFVIRRPDGRTVTIEVLPATRGGSALRGRSLVSAVLSEAAFFRDDTAAVNDTELFRAVAPRVLRGGLVVIETTPWAESGLSYDLFSANWGSPATCLVAHAPTLVMRPDAQTAALVERERERDPENARREFDAEFMSAGAGLFFDGSSITDADDTELLPQRASAGWCGVGGDVGLVRDSSAVVAIHVVDRTFVVAEALEFRPERGAPLKLSRVITDFCELAGRHGQRTILVDHHALEPAREHLPSGFSLTPAMSIEPDKSGIEAKKVDTYLHAKKLMNEGRIRIPGQYRRLITQLRAVMSRPTSGGGLSISSPRRSGHGDIVSAFVLALWQASQITDDGIDWATETNARGLNELVRAGWRGTGGAGGWRS